MPRAKSAIRADGEIDEIAWHDAVVSGPFVDMKSHEAARPYSEARLLHDDQFIYFVLYAADEDIRVPPHPKHEGDLGIFDHFVVRIQTASALYQLQFGADGSRANERFVTGLQPNANPDRRWEREITIGIDRDGTVNDPTDEDEEWIVEGALPFAALGLRPGEACAMSFSRCDTLKDGHRICSNWGGAPNLPPTGRVSLAP